MHPSSNGLIFSAHFDQTEVTGKIDKIKWVAEKRELGGENALQHQAAM